MTILAFLLMAAGLLIIFFGILGTWILPDLLLRFHASTKCGVTGSITVLMGLMCYARTPAFIGKLLIIMLFIFLTAPIVAHALAVSHLAESVPKPPEEQDDA